MDRFLKRKNEGTDDGRKKIKRDDCPHKERCYRKNPHHFKEYEHPHLIKFLETGDPIPEGMPQPRDVYLEQLEILKPILKAQNTMQQSQNLKQDKTEQVSNKETEEKISGECQKKVFSSQPSTSNDRFESMSTCTRVSKNGKITTFKDLEIEKCEPGTTLEKLGKNAPYNFFFTTIPESPNTCKERNAITFTDLLCPSLGPLKESLQINFMIDIDWLLKQYKARNLNQKPLTILYGDDWPDMIEFMNKFCPNVKHHFVKMKDPFGCHHSKIGIYAYNDNSIRVVVSSANLYYEDWNYYNQGLWISPRCKRLQEPSNAKDGESPTGFKSNLINYLKSYNLNILKDWISYVEKADFSDVRVFFIASIPGKHYPKTTGCHLHRVGELLSKYVTLPEKTTPQSEGPLSWGIVAQASSIGSMGKNPAEWLRGSLLRTLASHKKGPLPATSNATLSLVYPSVENVMKGYFGPQSGGCLPYSKATNEKQRWLQTYMHQWKADELTRTRAMPHIKSYCRISPCLTKLAYYLLTSANLSKSAWGGNIQKDGGVYVRSYEAGVLFLPNLFDEEYFEIKRTLSTKNQNIFPFIYDLPLTPFKSDDYPWCN